MLDLSFVASRATFPGGVSKVRRRYLIFVHKNTFSNVNIKLKKEAKFKHQRYFVLPSKIVMVKFHNLYQVKFQTSKICVRWRSSEFMQMKVNLLRWSVRRRLLESSGPQAIVRWVLLNLIHLFFSLMKQILW